MPELPSPLQIAEEVRAVHAALTALKPPPVEAARIHGARVACNPAVDSEFPSSNPNQVEWLDSDGELTPAVLGDFVEYFRSRSIRRFFLWTAPNGPGHGAARLLHEHGFTERTKLQYPTLARACASPPVARTDLTIRRAGPDDVSRHARAINEIQGPAADGYLRNIGRPGFAHFLAFDGDHPVAAAILFVNGNVGYLGSAATHPDHRARGGQSALIAARVAHAAELGCDWCASETLTFVSSSLANLLRAGFVTAFNARPFQWDG